MLRVESRFPVNLTSEQVAAMGQLVEHRFVLKRPIEEILRHYVDTTQAIALVYDQDDSLVGFQFYSLRYYEKLPVLHFSMSTARLGQSGVQRAIGKYLLFKVVGIPHMVRGFGVIGICNNPIAYCNMLYLGGYVFPDLTRSVAPCKYPEFYAWAIGILGLNTINLETGIIENRASGVGLLIVPPDLRLDNPLANAFSEYVGGNLNRGVLILIRSNLMQVVGAAMKRWLRAGVPGN
jgi:hypothetical protein